MTTPFSTALEAIRWGADFVPIRESRWMLEAAAVAAGKSPLFLDDAPLSQRIAAVFRSHVARRARGEPLAYVIGEASFRGHDLYVTPDVLIPRPETEHFVDLILREARRPCRILEQGTGSGAIAIALAIEAHEIEVTAVDISPSAVEIARRNAARHGVSVNVVEADLYPAGRFDMIVANLPYVPDDAELPEEVRDWEPRGALRGGKKGTETIERSIESAEKYLVPGGVMMYEIGEDQTGFSGFEYHRDLTGRIRYMIKRLALHG